MNYQPTLLLRLKQKISKKFLLIFSVCSLAIAGIVVACGDGGYYDDYELSSFAPEAFVNSNYSPFFFTSSTTYYNGYNLDDSNTHYSQLVVNEWASWFDGQIDTTSLKALIITAGVGNIDSASRYYKGKLNVLPVGLPDLKNSKADRRKVSAFFDYLILAKECESYAVGPGDYWSYEKTPVKEVPQALENTLLKAVDAAKDPFIKQRLWFQMVRYYYFKQRQHAAGPVKTDVPLPAYFAKEEASFPKNMMYYRTLGYLAGYYYQKGEYAQANYLYSLCYNYSFEMKIPSRWSFHPQNEKDWTATLNLAKDGAEKITLWHMLGTSRDEARAIKEIYAIDPKSEKLDLLLSRLVNEREMGGQPLKDTSSSNQAKRLETAKERALVNKIANEDKTQKPYYWNMAAGYLNALSGNYPVARTFYGKARKQLPARDTLVMAQYKLLDWLLYIQQLKRIDAKTEAAMVEPLNWLNSLSKNKKSIPNLRFQSAIGQSMTILSDLYKKQGDVLKAYFFHPEIGFYNSNDRIEAAKALLNKKNKTAFEQSMLNYYSINVGQLSYLQAILLVYQEKLDEAIVHMKEADTVNRSVMYANPFNINIKDCHDCDFEADKDKKHFTVLGFLEALKTIKGDLAAGKNVSRNAALLANAYYNITHYGNARVFYYSATVTDSYGDSPSAIPMPYRRIVTDSKVAEKYYLIARANAASKELKAKYTYMAAKCERNEIYNAQYNNPGKDRKYSWQFDFSNIPTGKYFAELKAQYSQTRYYQEILNECGYFKKYVSKKH
ncbi:hypothetical protein HDE68_003093 [Pedobacter cryoconitis]|uniref:Uncharacterized protein n=1 Tax=Pedobacter cryoconitis TaxID=188932 RepID=A0A7W9E114_9SPHI|nr:hypothetical protein [Pedobacter cryoconitis]MBB5637180.1 hypothetical protein [Pedobacter cryoconitis]